MIPKRNEKKLMEEALATMNAILAGREIQVTYGWPQQWTKLPIVTYSLAGVTDKDRDINKLVVGYLLTYNIDIWCKTPSECLDLFLLLDGALSKSGYTCVMQGTAYEEETRHHLRATATGYYDIIQNQIR